MRLRRGRTAWCSGENKAFEPLYERACMNQTFTPVQVATPDVLAWLEAQTALGHDRRALFDALLASGWQADSAARLLQATPAELLAFGVPPVAYAASRVPELPVTVPVPRPLLDAGGTMVDAGDKWVEIVHQGHEPEVMVFANLLSPAECEALMDAARPRLSRSFTVDTQTGGEELHPDRTSQGMFFTRSENEVVQRVEARIAKLLNWPIKNGEGLQVLRYPPGAQYRPHYDYFDPAQPGTAAILKRGGQRVGTLIMYLYEPEAGGATVFPDIDLQVAPRRGQAVFFSYAQASPASRTLHGGAPVTVGEKWIATKWLREREFI